MIKNICILRLSALGDVVNCLPSLRAIQQAHPNAKITWIINKFEYQLLSDITEVNWIVIDKSNLLESWLTLRKLPKFDILLHMQAALRASFFRTALRAKNTVGLDKSRVRDYQNLFCNQSIAPRHNAHSLETHLDFAKFLGANIQQLKWDLPLDKIKAEAEVFDLPDKYVVISPAASNSLRNWHAAGYSEVADFIWRNYNLKCILTGAKRDAKLGEDIADSNHIINLIGVTTIRQMTAIISGACLVITPDSGPAHIAVAVGTKVVGLYASSNPQRTGPYGSHDCCVDMYPDAVTKYLHLDVSEIRFGTRVNNASTMSLITVEKVVLKINRCL